MADWDPELYNRFRRYRAEAVEMIFARLALKPTDRIVDLGCGSGENTVELARRVESGSALGIDASPAMIDRAMRLHNGLDPALKSRVNFVLDDFLNLNADREYSVVFSNAALQWVRDHRSVLDASYRALDAGGALVIQMPANEHETAQATIHAMANEAPWKAVLGVTRTPSDENVLEPAKYRLMLSEIGFVDVDCYYHAFQHPMSSPAEIVEFVRATALRRFLDKLPPEKHPDFLTELTRRLEDAYGTRGPLTFNFRRLFLWARRPDGGR
jgi:trans-aconitate 2-methyltransferase